MDQAIRHARLTPRGLAPPTQVDAGLSNEPLDACACGERVARA